MAHPLPGEHDAANWSLQHPVIQVSGMIAVEHFLVYFN